jgi:hypothetical protein
MKRLARLAAALAEIVGWRESALLAGLGLVAYGAHAIYAPAAFFIPGCVLLYLAIVGLR